MGDVVGHLHRLGNWLDRLGVNHFLGCIHMPHDETKDPEEYKENGQTEEHDTHSQQGDADSIGVLTLQLGIFRLFSLDVVLNTWRHVLR